VALSEPKFGHFCHFWHFSPFLAVFGTFGRFWPFLPFLANFGPFLGSGPARFGPDLGQIWALFWALFWPNLDPADAINGETLLCCHDLLDIVSRLAAAGDYMP
jgi:hypothetical protein